MILDTKGPVVSPFYCGNCSRFCPPEKIIFRLRIESSEQTELAAPSCKSIERRDNSSRAVSLPFALEQIANCLLKRNFVVGET